MLINQTEMATLLGRTAPAGKRLVEKGVKYRLWTDANLRTWWTLGKKRRKAGKTVKPTKGAAGTWIEDDTEEDL